MTGSLAYDDLEAHARAFWRIAPEICTCDGDYHRVHPVLRAIGVMPGIARDREILSPLLPDLVKPGARVLIAGSADASLLQYFIDNCPARPLAFTIADLCPAPLALIDQLALPAGISVETRQIDLTRLDGDDRYDVILSHDMLRFVDEPTRVAILEALRANLAPDGRLVIVVRIFRTDTRSSVEAQADAWVQATEDRLADFPDLARYIGLGVTAALQSNFAARSTRRPKLTDPAQVIDVIARSGLRLETHAVGAEAPWENMPDGKARTRQPHVFVTARD